MAARKRTVKNNNIPIINHNTNSSSSPRSVELGIGKLRIKFGNFIFNINAKPDMIDIKIGKTFENYCAKLRLHQASSTKIHIETFTFDDDCLVVNRTNNNIRTRKGTSLLMDAIKTFVARYMPYVSTITLTDASKILCNKKKYTKRNNLYKNLGINTYDYYLCKYNSSYYEKNYGFQLLDPKMIDIHLKNIEIINELRFTDSFNVEFRDYLMSKKPEYFLSVQFDMFAASIKPGELVKDYVSAVRITDENCILIMAMFDYFRSVIPEFRFPLGAIYMFAIPK
jgi:hypothetical protein